MRSVQLPGFSNRWNADASQSISVEGVVLGRLLVATHTPGMSATQLRRQMGCSYKTAWFLLQRLRRGMVNKISQGAPIGAGCGGLNCAKRR